MSDDDKKPLPEYVRRVEQTNQYGLTEVILIDRRRVGIDPYGNTFRFDPKTQRAWSTKGDEIPMPAFFDVRGEK